MTTKVGKIEKVRQNGENPKKNETTKETVGIAYTRIEILLTEMIMEYSISVEIRSADATAKSHLQGVEKFSIPLSYALRLIKY